MKKPVLRKKLEADREEEQRLNEEFEKQNNVETNDTEVTDIEIPVEENKSTKKGRKKKEV